MDDLEDKESC